MTVIIYSIIDYIIGVILFMEDAFVKIRNVGKIYRSGDVEVHALHDVSIDIKQGEICVIIGQSGAGKTTLLNILGGMDTPTSGEIVIDGCDISKYSVKKLAEYRRRNIGFVFQFYNLIPNLTALENVEMASQLSENPRDPAEVLREVGLDERMANFPAQLSGGEQQRVAIARALCKSPKLLLCDEPTGALDYNTGKQILSLLEKAGREEGMTVLIITHNSAITKMADRVVKIKSGTVEYMEENRNIIPASEIEW